MHGASRTLTNQAEVHAALQRAFRRHEVRLFEHSGLSVIEQVAMHQQAEVVIGTHGAGFANILWASEGCDIVEIVPIDVHLDFQCGLTPFWQVVYAHPHASSTPTHASPQSTRSPDR